MRVKPSGMGLVPLQKISQAAPSSLLPGEKTARRLLAPCSWTSQPQELEEINVYGF